MKPVKIYSHNLGFRYTKYTHERPCIWDSTPIKYPILIYVVVCCCSVWDHEIFWIFGIVPITWDLLDLAGRSVRATDRLLQLRPPIYLQIIWRDGLSKLEQASKSRKDNIASNASKNISGSGITKKTPHRLHFLIVHFIRPRRLARAHQSTPLINHYFINQGFATIVFFPFSITFVLLHSIIIMAEEGASDRSSWAGRCHGYVMDGGRASDVRMFIHLAMLL